MPRLFIAVKIGPKAKKEAEIVQAELKKLFAHSKITWVDSEVMHLTLHFLGDCAEEQIPNIKQAIEKSAKGPKPQLVLEEVSAFPHIKDPRVLVIKAKDVGSHLANIQQNLGKELAATGLAIDNRPFKTHLTLGRIKFLQDHLQNLNLPVSSISWEVSSLELIESKLTPDGPEYTELASFSL